MRYNKNNLKNLDLLNKRVILRLDLNVPIINNQITDETRITQSLGTLNYLIEKNCKIIILSHLGRIKKLEDKSAPSKSLKLVADALSKHFPENTVHFFKENFGDNVLNAVKDLKPRQILVLENTRFQDVNDNGEVVKKESKNDPELSRFWASLGDVFVNDAFGTAHRAHASNVGIAKYSSYSAIGFLIERELLNLEKAVDEVVRPLVAILGGAKISDKLKVIDQIAQNSDKVLIAGGMAYTFFKAQNFDIGTSLVDETMIEECKNLLEKYKDKIVLPVDIYVTETFSDVPGELLEVNQGNWNNKMGMDIGPKTLELFAQVLKDAKTVIWNGPVGVFEFSNFNKGTKTICEILNHLTKNGAFTFIGGGDSAAAIHQFNLNNDISFISTGGGASLAYLEGVSLPGIDAISNAD